MTLRSCLLTRAIALAVFLSSFGILPSLSGTAIADVPARAAGEEAAESIAPDGPRGNLFPSASNGGSRCPPRSASGSGSGTAGGRS